MDTPGKLTRKDFTSDQEVRWCPGCGDYAILAAMQRALPDLGATRNGTVFVSGIGCSSRFPYYMNTYGFHTIHGRAPALATGLKLANPELDVWVATGDGDGLSIGGNHLLHLLRRNVDVQLMMFNNQIYGLTKGQYSPTSLVGQRTPSTPLGSIDAPIQPCMFALGVNARFVARGIDTMSTEITELFRRSREHRGTSFLEILQNCPVFNDGAFDQVKERDAAVEHQIWVQHGKPLRFGKDGSKGLRMAHNASGLEVVEIGKDGVTVDDVLVHDETNRSLGFLLASLQLPHYPMAFGVLFCDPAPSYDKQVIAQRDRAMEQQGPGDLQKLLRSGHTWTVG